MLHQRCQFRGKNVQFHTIPDTAWNLNFRRNNFNLKKWKSQSLVREIDDSRVKRRFELFLTVESLLGKLGTIEWQENLNDSIQWTVGTTANSLLSHAISIAEG